MLHADISLPDPIATTALGQALASFLTCGDTVLLDGPIGAGKSHLARALILARLAEENRIEDIPSPTFTLVQTYETARGEIWHADLYRLTHPDEVLELGLDSAFDTAICLIEWPDRLGPDQPDTALTIRLQPTATDQRQAHLAATDPKWRPLFQQLSTR